MTEFSVYRVELPEGRMEYRVFSESFLRSPLFMGGSTFEALLPLGRRYYQDVWAENEQEALETAKVQILNWKWSCYNCRDESDKRLMVTNLRDLFAE